MFVRTRRWGFLLGLFIPVYFAPACKHKGTGSEGKHDEGQLIHSNSVGQWLSLSDEEAAKNNWQLKNAFPDSTPMVQRMQAWADKIHYIVKEKNQDAVNIPHPRVRMINMGGVNAFALSAYYCVDSIINFLGPGRSDIDQNMMVSTGGYAICKHLGGDPNLEIRYLQHKWRHKEGCELKVVDSQIYATAPCKEKVPEKGKRVRSYCDEDRVQSNHIVFHRDALKKFSEEQALIWLAHELGHYYKSHATHKEDKYYNYFYRLAESNPSSKPARLPDDDHYVYIGKSYNSLLKLLTQVPGEKFSYLLTLAALQTVDVEDERIDGRNSCLPEAEDCEAQCEDAVNDVHEAFDDIESLASSNEVSDGAQEKYLAFQNHALKCFSNYSVEGSKKIFDKAADELLQGAIKRPEISGENNKNFAEYLLAVDSEVQAQMAKSRQQIQDDVKKAQSGGLGWYTDEQEADELSVEFAVRLGLSPQRVPQVFFESFGPGELLGNQDQGHCENNFRTGFKTPVFIGNVDDPHHDSCYRAYNVYREMKAHEKYYAELAKNAPKLELLNENEWKKLQSGF